jgi:hypothetical protein
MDQSEWLSFTTAIFYSLSSDTRFFSYSSGMPEFWGAFLCISVEAGLEKRRYLLFFKRQRSKKSLVSATFFTERERPAGTVIHKKASPQ